MNIRSATAADIPRMMELTHHSVTAAQWSRASFESHLDTSHPALVLEEQGMVAAFIVGKNLGEQWEIENVAVAPDARRRGLGSHLVGEFIKVSRAAGAKSVFLEVRESNRAARALYEKWAFTESGRRRNYYSGPPEDAILYRFDAP